MILPDANVLIHAVNSSSRQHDIAVRALQVCFDDMRGVGFTWVAMLAFLRLSTRSGIFPRPLTTDEAFLVIDQWLGHPRARVANPGERHAEILAQLLKSAGTAGNLTTDAHLAALAIEHGGTVLSFDRDFARFAGVAWTMPSDD